MSLLDLFLKIVGIRKMALHKVEELSTQQKLEKEKLKAARESANRVTYEGQSLAVFPAEQDFYGDKENPGLNKIDLFFEIEQTDKSCYLTFSLFVSPDQKTILPGSYRLYDTPREMCMQGVLSFYGNEEEEEEDIKVIDGRLIVKQTGELFYITADCLCENKEKLLLHYEGPLTYNNYVPGVNGTGHFLYEEKEYPLYVGIEEYNGVISQYNYQPENKKVAISEGSWADQLCVELILRDDDTDWNHYLTFEIFQEEGETIQPGEYTFAKEPERTPPGTFTGYLGIPDEDDEKDIFLEITAGIIKITRLDCFTIEGTCELENGKSVTFTYTGKPEWYDES